MRIPIETDRLRLRELREETDLAPLLSFIRDPDSMRYMLWFVEGEGDLRFFFAQAAAEARNPARKAWLLAVEEKAGGGLGGFCCLDIEGKDNPGREEGSSASGEIGYWLLEGARGKGYATEIGAALIDFGFRALGLHRVYAKCDELNLASARVLEKLGMRREGCLREHVWLRDHWRSSLYYGILSGEYGKETKKDLTQRHRVTESRNLE